MALWHISKDLPLVRAVFAARHLLTPLASKEMTCVSHVDWIPLPLTHI